jgi:VanZ family protein
MYRFRRIWLLVGCGMVAAVVVLSLIPVEVDLGEDSDKLAHFLAYGSLSLWFGMIFTGTSRQLGITVAIVALGVVLEFLQGLTGYRTFSIADMIANALGAVLGWGLAQTPLKNGLVWIERRIDALAQK